MWHKCNFLKPILILWSLLHGSKKWLLWLLKMDNFAFNVCSLMHDSTDQSIKLVNETKNTPAKLFCSKPFCKSFRHFRECSYFFSTNKHRQWEGQEGSQVLGPGWMQHWCPFLSRRKKKFKGIKWSEITCTWFALHTHRSVNLLGWIYMGDKGFAEFTWGIRAWPPPPPKKKKKQMNKEYKWIHK